MHQVRDPGVDGDAVGGIGGRAVGRERLDSVLAGDGGHQPLSRVEHVIERLSIDRPVGAEPPGEVASRLAREWRERIALGNWKEGFESRTDLSPDNRIERTVFVRAPNSIRYGEVARVIDAIKGAGAEPVGLQTDELPN